MDSQEQRALHTTDIARAWATIWDAKQKDLRDGRDFRGQSYYITAQELERHIRDEATWASATGRVRFTTDLFDACRTWLLRQASAGRLQVHNFDRGHCSGARFRPAGAPLAPNEERTLQQKQRDETTELRHMYCDHGAAYEYDGETRYTRAPGPLCTAARRNKTSYGYRFKGVTRDAAKVTCPRCLKAMAEAAQQPDATAAEQV